VNGGTLRNLAIVVAVLLAALIGLELADDTVEDSAGQRLFPGLKASINDVDSLAVERYGEETVSIVRNDDGWVVANRDGFPADVAQVREVLLALSDARILEQKTANPARYEALGVRDPEIEGSTGIRLTATGGDARFSLVIGKAAAGSSRYVRRADEAGSALIDRDPGVPEDAAGWLASELVDIDTDSVSSVVIEHADGERIAIAKSSADDVDFTVSDIPDGRELSYPTVANGIAGALNGLELEDVRDASGGQPFAMTRFTTFDGQQIDVSAYRDEDDSIWIALSASAGSGDDDRVAAVNSLAAGREFRIASFRGDQLTRRWEDILKDLPDAE